MGTRARGLLAASATVAVTTVSPAVGEASLSSAGARPATYLERRAISNVFAREDGNASEIRGVYIARSNSSLGVACAEDARSGHLRIRVLAHARALALRGQRPPGPRGQRIGAQARAGLRVIVGARRLSIGACSLGLAGGLALATLAGCGGESSAASSRRSAGAGDAPVALARASAPSPCRRRSWSLRCGKPALRGGRWPGYTGRSPRGRRGTPASCCCVSTSGSCGSICTRA